MSTSITSSNYFNVSSSSSNGISGLFSGLDTDSMVEKMLSGTQKKIDTQNQLQTQIEWKQSIYQDVIEKINSFSSSYFDTSYGSSLSKNLSSASLFNTMKATLSSGSSVKVVSASSAASIGDMSVIVSQLASSAKISSVSKMSGTQTISGTEMDIESIKSTLDSGEELSFSISLDGTSKTISFSSSDFSGTVDADSIKNALDAKLEKAFGSYVKVDMTDSKLSFSVNLFDTEGELETGHELTITGSSANAFGIVPGSSTLLTGSSKLGALAGVQGDTYSFTINGTEFNFSSTDSVSSMMSKINASDAGVRISYSSMTDTFSMESTSTGEQYGINMTQETGNLLSVFFGDSAVSAGSQASSSVSLHTSTVASATSGLADDYSTTSASMSMTVNGVKYGFSLNDRGTPYTKSEVESELNSWLTSKFGESDGVSNISYADGKLTTAQGYLVSFDKTTVDTTDADAVSEAAKTDLALAFGFSIEGSTNAVSATTNISDVLQLQGLSFKTSDGSEATTVADIAQYSYDGTDYDVSFEDGKLLISGASTLDLTWTGLDELFGATVVLGDGTTSSGAVTAGTDALLTINGVSTSRSSNTFTIDGITLTASSVSEDESIISTERDADTIVDAIKSFVSDYNSMVKDLYELITEDADWRDYDPLTDAQKDEMTDDEIEKWTEKAKTGLVRSDSTISSFLTDIRAAMYSTCEKAGIGLYSIGIDTTKWELSGQLTLDESALRNAIANDPSAIATLFTDATDGIATQVSAICDKTAKLSAGSPGTLVSYAGAKNWSANAKSNELYLQLDSINDKLDDLKDKYDDEKERYWAKFSKLETIMANYSSQSNMITSMFS